MMASDLRQPKAASYKKIPYAELGIRAIFWSAG